MQNQEHSSALFRTISRISAFGLLAAAAATARAHDPVFGLGPHTLYRGGFEVHAGAHGEKRGDDRETELELALAYGLTGDWSAGVELPYVRAESHDASSSGIGNAGAFTKYRFWRNDMLGAQESAAVFGKVVLPTGEGAGHGGHGALVPGTKDGPAAGSGSDATDYVAGLAYGYEGLEWYRWAALRYRYNGNDQGLERGDRVLFDLVGGWRPTPPEYREPDTVWLLELNGEYTQRTKRNTATLPDTGGVEWFLSPGIFWTYRNFAVKAGVQVPVWTNRFGEQEDSDYRAKLEFEWHL